MRGALGDTERARDTSTTPPSAASAARCTHAGASLKMSTACFLLLSNQTFCLYTVHMYSIAGDSSCYFYHFPSRRGGSYGASGCHLRTPGPKSHGAIYCDYGAPGDL